MIEAMLALSTAHLTPHSCNVWLPACDYACFAKGDYGWFVYVPDDMDDDIPGDLVQCIDLARSLHCDWVMFDRDQAPHSTLPLYAWD